MNSNGCITIWPEVENTKDPEYPQSVDFENVQQIIDNTKHSKVKMVVIILDIWR